MVSGMRTRIAAFGAVAVVAVGGAAWASGDEPADSTSTVVTTQHRCVKSHDQKRTVTTIYNADGTVAKASAYSSWAKTKRTC